MLLDGGYRAGAARGCGGIDVAEGACVADAASTGGSAMVVGPSMGLSGKEQGNRPCVRGG